MLNRYKDVWLQFGVFYIVGTLVIMALVSFLCGFLESALDNIFYPRGAVYEAESGIFKSKGEKFADILEIIFIIIGMFILFFYLKARLMPEHNQIPDQDYRGRS